MLNLTGRQIRSKRQALIPFPRTGRSALIPYPRTGKRAALVAFPRTGKRAALMAFPRTGKRVFGPRTGKRASLIAMPRTGKRSSLYRFFPNPMGFGYSSFPEAESYKRDLDSTVPENSYNDVTSIPLTLNHESETPSDSNEDNDEDSEDAKNKRISDVDSKWLEWLSIQKKSNSAPWYELDPKNIGMNVGECFSLYIQPKTQNPAT